MESPRNSRRSLSRVVGSSDFCAEGKRTMSQRADQQVPVTEGVAKVGLQFLQVRGCHTYFAGGEPGAAGVVGVAGCGGCGLAGSCRRAARRLSASPRYSVPGRRPL